MKSIPLKNIEEITAGLLHNTDGKNLEVTSVVSDSRKVKKGSLFLCIRGEKSDGHDFAQKALDAGAVAVLSEKEMPDLTGPYLLVESVFQATKNIAEYYRRMLKVKVIGITGSVGKTSTKEFVAEVLSQRYKVCKTKGNLNNEWGVPFTIFDIEPDDEIAVIEMGINHFGEMTRLSKMARPNIAIITNIGEAHLEFLESRDGILKAKSEIFNYMMPDAKVILNGDDDKLATVTSAGGIRPLFFGFGKGAAARALNVEYKGLKGSLFDLILSEGGGLVKLRISLPVPGEIMIYNALAAALAGFILGLSPIEIKEALEHVKGMSGRSEIVDTGSLKIIDDSYNASPSAMETSIDILKSSSGRKVAILGDMFELGENSEALHFRVGKYAGEANLDVIACVGRLSRNTYQGAKEVSDGAVLYFDNVDSLIDALPGFINFNDNVLVKASHGMNFNRITKYLKNYG